MEKRIIAGIVTVLLASAAAQAAPPGTFGASQIDKAKQEATRNGKPVAYLLSDSRTT